MRSYLKLYCAPFRMRIAVLGQFTYPSVCGGLNRIHHIVKPMADHGHEVHLFSTNLLKGTKKTLPAYEVYQGIHVHRSPVLLQFGEAYFWRFAQALRSVRPDVIEVHGYRQPYSTLALKVAKELGVPCFLTTHAPFLDKGLRSWPLELLVVLYDALLGKRVLNAYTKVLAISRWEIPLLRKLGCRADKIVYVPNGVAEEFFHNTKVKKQKQMILFLGRISPVKDLFTLVKAAALACQKHPSLMFHVVGFSDGDYEDKVKRLVTKYGLERHFVFPGPVYDLAKKIQYYSEASLFVLPSRREGMPQVPLEAMARGCVVLSSDTDGGKEVVRPEHGFLFPQGDFRKLADLLAYCLEHDKALEAKREAGRRFARHFRWKLLSQQVEKLYQESIKKESIS